MTIKNPFKSIATIEKEDLYKICALLKPYEKAYTHLNELRKTQDGPLNEIETAFVDAYTELMYIADFSLNRFINQDDEITFVRSKEFRSMFFSATKAFDNFVILSYHYFNALLCNKKAQDLCRKTSSNDYTKFLKKANKFVKQFPLRFSTCFPETILSPTDLPISTASYFVKQQETPQLKQELLDCCLTCGEENLKAINIFLPKFAELASALQEADFSKKDLEKFVNVVSYLKNCKSRLSQAISYLEEIGAKPEKGEEESE